MLPNVSIALPEIGVRLSLELPPEQKSPEERDQAVLDCLRRFLDGKDKILVGPTEHRLIAAHGAFTVAEANRHLRSEGFEEYFVVHSGGGELTIDRTSRTVLFVRRVDLPRPISENRGWQKPTVDLFDVVDKFGELVARSQTASQVEEIVFKLSAQLEWLR